MPEATTEQRRAVVTPEFEISLIGNLGRDPEMRYTPSGQPVVTLSVGANLPLFANGETIIAPAWFRITVWGRQAETCNQYLHKGDQILVKADRMTFDPQTGGPRMYQRQDGTWGTSFELTARKVKFLKLKGGNGEPPADEVVGEEPQAAPQSEEIIFS